MIFRTVGHSICGNRIVRYLSKKMRRSSDLPIAFVALVVLGCLGAVQVSGKTTINLDVYYESLCPDSIYFITRELGPNYKNFKDYLNVNLIPFGKASWIRGEENRPTEFTCQHGPNECEGNRAQACALSEIEQNVKTEDQQQKQIDLVACVMGSRNPASAVPLCAERNGLGSEALQRIARCERSKTGDDLLIRNGERTKAFESPLSFVPSIVINGEKKSEAFRNFSNVICQLIPGNEKPSVCLQ